MRTLATYFVNSRNLISRPLHLQERLLRPAVRPALPEGVLRRGLQAGELHRCTLATYCVKSRNLVPGVPAVHLGLRHLRLPDGAVRVRARLHGVLLRRALPQGNLRQEVPRKVRVQGMVLFPDEILMIPHFYSLLAFIHYITYRVEQKKGSYVW